jgi:hypothetical protein
MAPLDFSSDLDAILADAGETVVLGPDTVFGIVRRPDASELESAGAGSLITRQLVVTVRTGALTALAVGAVITVGGTAYRVRDHLAVEHGATTRIHCIQNP